MRPPIFAPLFVVAAALACVQPRDVTSIPRRDPVYAGLVGKWQGTLEERDTRDPTRRVRHATSVVVQAVPEADGLALQFATDDGAAPRRIGTDLLQLDKSLTAARWGDTRDTTPQQFDVIVHEAPPSPTVQQPLRLVLEGVGSVDDLPAMIRETVTIAPGEIHIIQETRTLGARFAFQRAYVLRRVG